MTSEIMERYGLPDLPEETSDDDQEARKLILWRFNDTGIELAPRVSYTDAMDYCSRPDTEGDGWFVGFDRSDQ